ncbi:HNH endonuclease [Spiroplasma endosymbiont of Labia minor]|uniref:HNH endonuclease n=1 Tax=Spiroplasma endosymbiont of Labia minor TaxID=3066305 RepID=UPI0030CEBDB6
MDLNQLNIDIWNKAIDCECGDESQDSGGKHKLCGICKETMVFDAHESKKGHQNSIYRWNIDYIRPLSKGGKNNFENMHAVHVECNQNKII